MCCLAECQEDLPDTYVGGKRTRERGGYRCMVCKNLGCLRVDKVEGGWN